MPITASDLPGILSAVKRFRHVIESTPYGLNDAAARAAVPTIEAARDALRRLLTPSNPTWTWNHNPDIANADLPPDVAQLLDKVWCWIVRDIHHLPPPFGATQRRDWLVLLDNAVKALESRETAGPFESLLEYAAREMGRKERRIVEKVCQAKGAYLLKNLALDMKWGGQWKDGWNNAVRRINAKLARHAPPYRLSRVKNAAVLEPLAHYLQRKQASKKIP